MSVGVALLVLAAAAAVIWAVQRRAAERRGAAVPSGEEPVGPEPVIAPVEPVEPVDVTAPVTVTAVGVVEPGTTALLVSLGEAMVDSGYAVTQVQTTLHQVARVNGAPGAEIIVLPTALLVSVPGEAAVETAAAAAGASRLRLDQIDAVSRVVAGAESGRLAPARAMERLASARAMSPPFGPVGRTVGYVVLTVGLALILRASAIELLVAAALGAVVGLLQLAAPRLTSAYQAVLPVAASFLVSTAVFLLARGGWDVGVFAPLVAPLVTFLPGALLTTGVLELSTGQMISGSGRLATGLMQLVLLALGIVAGAQLVGVPASTVGEPAVNPLGELTPWLGVAVFGVGVVVHNCARRASLGWILLVLYVAYGAQVVGGLFLGGVLSAFVGALVMAPVAVFVAAQRTGPPTQVSFLPAFWLLVPGALGLVGVTKLIEQDLSDALDALVTTGATMIGIAFGVLIGLALGSSIARAPLPGLRRR